MIIFHCPACGGSSYGVVQMVGKGFCHTDRCNFTWKDPEDRWRYFVAATQFDSREAYEAAFGPKPVLTSVPKESE